MELECIVRIEFGRSIRSEFSVWKEGYMTWWRGWNPPQAHRQKWAIAARLEEVVNEKPLGDFVPLQVCGLFAPISCEIS